MYKIYVPMDENFNSCFVIIDKDTIRAYDTIPTENVSYNYRDYFINSHYIYKEGSDIFDENLPICINSENITHDIYYRNDIADIFQVFFIFGLIVFSIPIILLQKFRKRS